VELPSSLPEHLNVRSAWRGEDMRQNPDMWTLWLDEQHITELKSALRNVAKQGLALHQLNVDTFALPVLGGILRDMRTTLIGGHGFCLLRGIDPADFDEGEFSTLFYGVGAYIGSARSQNAQGDLLGHVRDIGVNSSDNTTRIYQTSERQTFHTDSADVVGLICLKDAKSGGKSLLVSAATIYNEMRARRPDLLPFLFDDIATDRRGEVPAGMKPFFEIPVFTWGEGFLNVMYQRQYIDSAQRFEGTLELTENHVAALDMFDTLANDPALNFSMRLAPGDMQFVHNHSLLHDRTGFEDWSDPVHRRHLLRLWLSVPGDRPLPVCFAQRFGSVAIGDRGGIVAVN